MSVKPNPFRATIGWLHISALLNFPDYLEQNALADFTRLYPELAAITF